MIIFFSVPLFFKLGKFFSNKASDDNAFQIYQGDLPPLEAPAGLAGVSMPAGKISLTWNAVDSAAGYVEYRMAPGQVQLSPLNHP